jgi:hypothetical protein
MSSKQAATIEPCSNGYAVIVGGEIISDGFVSRGHAAMWATRKGLYEPQTPRRRQTELPPDLVAGS